MLDPTGHAPGAVPPHVLSALRSGPVSPATRSETDPHTAFARAQADAALAKARLKAAELDELRARYAADTTDNAWKLQVATLEAAQAMLAAYVHLRDRVDLG